MKHILLDVNVVVDLCVDRPGAHNSRLAVALAKQAGLGIWMYVGSVQTMEYVVGIELRRVAQEQGRSLLPNKARFLGKQLLAELATGYQWLAALSGEGNVFADDDPEGAQLFRSLDRFPEGQIFLLTRDKPMRKRYPRQTVTPEALIETYRQIPSQPLPFLDLDLPAQQDVIRQDLEQRIHTVLHHGKYILGPEVADLETQLCTYTGAKHTITCSSGTDALLMALMALDVGPGDAVFTTPFTFVATADVIARLGATPVFVDIDPTTYNIDPSKLEETVSRWDGGTVGRSDSQTVGRLNGCGQRRSLPWICMGCHVIMMLSTRWRKSMIWLSFRTGRSRLGRSIRGGGLEPWGTSPALRSFRPNPLEGMATAEPALQAMTTLPPNCAPSASTARARTNTTPSAWASKAAWTPSKPPPSWPNSPSTPRSWKPSSRWLISIQISSACRIPTIPPEMKSAWALYTILCPSTQERSAIQARLKEHAIPNMVYYAKPLHLQPVFAHLGYKLGDFPVSEDCASRVLSLPMNGYMTDKEVENVVRVLCG